jgi:hypothetical protein
LKKDWTRRFLRPTGWFVNLNLYLTLRCFTVSNGSLRHLVGAAV